MHCLRHLAILMLLVPMPSTSPFLLAVAAVVAYLTIRPCGYCLATLAVVFCSTSPSSPFLAALAPETVAPAPPPAEPTLLASPIPNRGAFYLNGGHIFDPCLGGYEKMRQVWEDAPSGSHATNSTATDASAVTAGDSALGPEDASNDAVADPSAEKVLDVNDKEPGRWPGKWKFGLSTSMFSPRPPQPESERHKTNTEEAEVELPPLPSYPATPPIRPLPPGYLDLRIKGMGVVLDIGWKRTEEGLDWELAENKYAAELAKYRRAERELKRKRRAIESKQAPASNWKGASFLGSW